MRIRNCFLRYLTDQSTDSGLTRRLENAAQSAKTRREWSVEYMTLYEIRKMDREEGSNERARDIAVKMIRANEPDEKITSYTGLSALEVSEIRESLSAV